MSRARKVLEPVCEFYAAFWLANREDAFANDAWKEREAPAHACTPADFWSRNPVSVLHATDGIAGTVEIQCHVGSRCTCCRATIGFVCVGNDVDLGCRCATINGWNNCDNRCANIRVCGTGAGRANVIVLCSGSSGYACIYIACCIKEKFDNGGFVFRYGDGSFQWVEAGAAAVDVEADFAAIRTGNQARCSVGGVGRTSDINGAIDGDVLLAAGSFAKGYANMVVFFASGKFCWAGIQRVNEGVDLGQFHGTSFFCAIFTYVNVFTTALTFAQVDAIDGELE